MLKGPGQCPTELERRACVQIQKIAWEVAVLQASRKPLSRDEFTAGQRSCSAWRQRHTLWRPREAGVICT